jgi:CheY-like chemotaxis protein
MSTSRVLLVEDEDALSILIKRILDGCDIDVTRCTDAESAWVALTSNASGFDAILLDRQLPDRDGFELLRQIKEHDDLKDIPVVIETGSDDPESIRQGIAIGAYYYLTKPFHPKLLQAVLRAALADRHQFAQSQRAVHEAGRALSHLENGVFRCRTMAEAGHLAYGLANAFPDPECVAPGLLELLLNAVEHGNLAITYEDKSRLMYEGQWTEEINRRLDAPEFRDREVAVTFSRNAEEFTLTIQDQGDGFDWREYLEFNPRRAFDSHGRGIAIARKMSFDSVEYHGNGNTVIAKVVRPARP